MTLLDLTDGDDVLPELDDDDADERGVLAALGLFETTQKQDE